MVDHLCYPKVTVKKAQSIKPSLYEIPLDTSDLHTDFEPDGEETVTLEKESRSKLDKDTVKPYNYTYQNSLYETFKPPSKTYLDQLERAKEVRKTMWRKTLYNSSYSLLTLDAQCSWQMTFEHGSSSLGRQCEMVSAENNTSGPVPQCLVLHQMTSDHHRSELKIQDHSNEQSSSKLVPKVVP
ncbi:hypothetical protein Tco_0976951 [Tanacetum coccineum]|uniref:Uncharacterized protein n=1 Tax=Tanacetum coccineum TaxID=301880 RepID=A0ABQ5EIQ7_9ASTR